MRAQSVEQCLRLQQPATTLRSEADRIRSVGECFFVAPDEQLEAKLGGIPVAEFKHLAEFVPGIDVQQWKRNGRGMKRLLRKAQHNRGIFANGVKHHGPLEFSGNLADNVNALLHWQRFLGYAAP